MAITSKIQWTDATWNIARGCTKVDDDCKFCYMYRESLNATRYEPKKVVRTKTVFDLPLRISEPSKIFTSSLTDFFHEDCDIFRDEAWEIIKKCPHHTFQILTKRPERIANQLSEKWAREWAKGHFRNILMGTSVGSNGSIHRVRELIKASLLIPIPKIFLSLEPLHGPVTLTDYYFKGMGFDHLRADQRTSRARAHAHCGNAGSWLGPR